MDAIAVSLLVLNNDQKTVEQVVRATQYLLRSNDVEMTVNTCAKREMNLSIAPAAFGSLCIPKPRKGYLVNVTYMGLEFICQTYSLLNQTP